MRPKPLIASLKRRGVETDLGMIYPNTKRRVSKGLGGRREKKLSERKVSFSKEMKEGASTGKRGGGKRKIVLRKKGGSVATGTN